MVFVVLVAVWACILAGGLFFYAFGQATRVTRWGGSRRSSIREPPAFSGTPADLAEWVFTLEEALASQPQENEVRYAVSYLTGDARRWFMTLCNNGMRPTTWTALKAQLVSAFAPDHEKERNRGRLLKARQRGPLEDYVSEFRRLCLLSPDVDELTRTLVFVEGLRAQLKYMVKREHPANLAAAVKAARWAAEQEDEDTFTGTGADMTTRTDTQMPEAPVDEGRTWPPVNPGRYRGRNKLPPSTILRLQRDRRCFHCGKVGHIARFCPTAEAHPNANRQ